MKAALHNKGYHSVPSLKLEPFSKHAAPVLFVTSCGIYDYNPSYHKKTATKSYYPPTGKKHLINATAAAVLEALARGLRVIIQVEPKKHPELARHVDKHPQHNLVSYVPLPYTSSEFVPALYETILKLSKKQPVSRVDFCLYNSYSQGNADPFIPIFEENHRTVIDIASLQIEFFQIMGQLALDLLVNRGQEDLRFLAVTSLASRRMLAHLYSDAVHKTLASVYLQGFAYEAPHYTGKQNVSVVELMPGMVDTGTYDSENTRKMIMMARQMDGFQFDPNVNHTNIRSWPMMPPADLGKIAACYLWEDTVSKAARKRLDNYTCAGCPAKMLQQRIRTAVKVSENGAQIERRLPDFCFCAGVSLGKLPTLRKGYMPVPLSPIGQYF